MSSNDRPVKCPKCEQHFKRSEQEFTFHKNRYWHKACFESKHQLEQDKEKLLAYIEQLLHKKIDYKIKNQLNNYITNKNYTYKEIYNALYYFYNIRGNSTQKANGGIGIVPYIIDESKAYFNTKQKRASREIPDPITNVKRITIKDPTKLDKYVQNRHIDINYL